MNPSDTQTLLEILNLQRIALERIADALERLAPASTAAPNYQFPLENFSFFDWSSITATVISSDDFGAAIVNWRGQQFVRRSPSNKFGEAIWFSRCVGKGEDGENKYERLVTFKPLSKVEVEPVPSKVREAMGQRVAPFQPPVQKLVQASNNEIWRNWKSPQDAIAWAATQLPQIPQDVLKGEFENLPASNGKKALAWVERVNQLKEAKNW